MASRSAAVLFSCLVVALALRLTIGGLELHAASVFSSVANVSGPLRIGTAVHGLNARSPDKHDLDITATHGWKVVYFWSDTCPCVSACERISLVPLAKRYAGRVAFYPVLSDSYELGLKPADLQARIRAHHLPYPVLLDTSHQVVRTLGAYITTDTFILDPHNKVVFEGAPDDFQNPREASGQVKPDQTFLGKALKAALAGKPVPQPPIPLHGCIIAY